MNPVKPVLVTRMETWDHRSLLTCPKCGETSGLHHHSIQVFDRGEDEKDVALICVSHGQVSRRRVANQLSNPSDRRHGLRIRFWCEMCDMDMDLCIAQHKGMTMMFWAEGNDREHLPNTKRG